MINTLSKYVIPIYATSLLSVGMAKTVKNKQFESVNDFIEISSYNCIKSPLFIPIGLVGCLVWTGCLHITIWPALIGYSKPLKILEEIPDKIKNWKPSSFYL